MIVYDQMIYIKLVWKMSKDNFLMKRLNNIADEFYMDVKSDFFPVSL